MLIGELRRDIYNFNLIRKQEARLWCFNLDVILTLVQHKTK